MKEIFPPESWQDTRMKRNEYFSMLRNLKDDYHKSDSASNGFLSYIEDTVGIRPIMHDGNMFTENYSVVDEEKYFLYKLKQ